jgi:L-fuconolactonase
MMEIIDAHHHLWDPGSLHYDLLDGPLKPLRRSFTVREFREVARKHGVTASVCVEAVSAGAEPVAETNWLLGQAAADPGVAAVVAWAPIESPGLPDYLADLRRRAGSLVTGVRRSFETTPPEFLTSGPVISGVRQLAGHGYSFDLVLFHPSLPAATELVTRCPEVQFVLDHLGKPPVRAGDLDPWRHHIRALSRLPNVACKISGLITEADRAHWRARQLHPYIDHAVECFGWHRVLFGSDWPVCNLAGGYESWLDALDACIGQAAESERALFYRDNACRIYRPGPRQDAAA